ncbi:unnamed protein product [Paramecium sonneborni]|uniref:Protein kinase domain-containing protein n=1 Tax=Paramecium sonneborni TaxID=65129 RepID=A0A8S1RSZ8_9CILI|nr:unnamed protein product [Paramecium sonneborni]
MKLEYQLINTKYASPQLLDEKQKFTNSADIFSLGIVCYELIFGCLPYKVNNYYQLIQQLRQLEFNPVKINRSIPGMYEDIANLIENMLKYHESQRISWNSLFSHHLLSERLSTPIQFIRPQVNPQTNKMQINKKLNQKLNQKFNNHFHLILASNKLRKYQINFLELQHL